MFFVTDVCRCCIGILSETNQPSNADQNHHGHAVESFFLWHSGSPFGPNFAFSTPQKTNVDTQNDGLEMVTPFKYGHFWYLY